MNRRQCLVICLCFRKILGQLFYLIALPLPFIKVIDLILWFYYRMGSKSRYKDKHKDAALIFGKFGWEQDWHSFLNYLPGNSWADDSIIESLSMHWCMHVFYDCGKLNLPISVKSRLNANIESVCKPRRHFKTKFNPVLAQTSMDHWDAFKVSSQPKQIQSWNY